MNNPETLAKLGTENTGPRPTKHKHTTQKTKTISSTDPTKTAGEPSREVNCIVPVILSTNTVYFEFNLI